MDKNYKSDIDVCVVSNQKFTDRFDQNVKLKILTNQVDASISPILFSTADLNDKYDTLATEIKTFGQVITP